MSLCPHPYTSRSHLRNDFIGPEGQVDCHILSGAPLKTKNYLTLFKPFDKYIWGFLIASIMAVSAALIMINMVHAIWSTDSAKESAFQSTVYRDWLKGFGQVW